MSTADDIGLFHLFPVYGLRYCACATEGASVATATASASQSRFMCPVDARRTARLQAVANVPTFRSVGEHHDRARRDGDGELQIRRGIVAITPLPSASRSTVPGAQCMLRMLIVAGGPGLN